MKKSLIALTAALTLAVSGIAFASTAELTVKGLITPSACTPSLSGNVDYGKISIKDLNLNTPTNLAPVTVQLAVLCDASTLFALSGTDNRPGSSTIPDGYGLGLASNSQKIGNFTLSLKNPVADNLVVSPLESSDGGTTWRAIGNAIWQSMYWAAFGKPGDTQPTPIKEVKADLQVNAEITRASFFPQGEEIQIDGSATITVKYM